VEERANLDSLKSFEKLTSNQDFRTWFQAFKLATRNINWTECQMVQQAINKMDKEVMTYLDTTKQSH
jgi:hypothetical protein